jgi:hypothetical protein
MSSHQGGLLVEVSPSGLPETEGLLNLGPKIDGIGEHRGSVRQNCPEITNSDWLGVLDDTIDQTLHNSSILLDKLGYIGQLVLLPVVNISLVL